MKLTITAKINGKVEELLTLSQAGNKLHVTRQSVLKMVNNGRLRAVRTKLGSDEIYLVIKNDLRKIIR